jgi:PAS domain S-box-containing protein
LPAGSDIRFKDLSFWDQYQRYVISAISLIVVQTGLIGSLLAERRRRRRAEEARRHLAAIVEFSDDAIIGTSLDGQILSWNPGAESMYGYTAHEMLGRHILAIVPPDRAEELSESMRKRRRGERIRDFETVRLRKDGTRIDVSVNISPIKDDRGRVIADATITRDVSERKRAEQELHRLTGHLLTLQDDERRRLARELHDVTAQNLFAINMNLSRLQRGRVESAEVKEILAESRNLGQQSLQEIRTLSYLLHPPMLDQAGLVDALKWYVDGFVKRSGIDVEVLPIQEIGRLPSEVETALFRIVQEGLSNIKRHSGSNSANIKLEKKKDRVILQIRDHGRGMKSEVASTESDGRSLGVGIPGMRQRLRQLGGNLQIESSDRGTLVTAMVPIANGVKP